MEDLIAIIMLGLLILFFMAAVAIFRPLPRFWLPDKKRALIVGGVSLAVFGVFGSIVDPDARKQREEQTKAGEAEPATTQEDAWLANLTEEQRQDPLTMRIIVTCRKDARCWGERNIRDAEGFCEGDITDATLGRDSENRFVFRHRWTNDRFRGSLFSYWNQVEPNNESLLVYWGDKIQVKNDFGIYVNHVYKCYYDTDSRKFLRIEIAPGRL